MNKLALILILAIGSFQSSVTKHLNLENGLAIQGYDPVSYFSKDGPSRGMETIKLARNGATYYFVSEENRQKFMQNPEQYEPAYGGWCAYAMGDTGEKVRIDPETYKIVEGKLYLFYNFYFNNTLKGWNKDEARLKKKAEENWLNILKNKGS